MLPWENTRAIDENLTWKYHVDNITKKVSSGIGAFKRMRDFITTETAIRVYQSLVEPYFSYCAPVWDGLGKNKAKNYKNYRIGPPVFLTYYPFVHLMIFHQVLFLKNSIGNQCPLSD
jgi:hypothetical protein